MNTLLELFVSSSVLILCLLLLHRLVRGHIPPRVMYALWLVAALRLILPVSIVESPVSVMNAVEFVRTETFLAAPDVTEITVDAQPAVADETEQSQSATTSPVSRKKPDYNIIIVIIWITGSVVCAACIATVNLRLMRTLKSNRQAVQGFDCKLPVYSVSGLPSPCLFCRAIYVTPEIAAENEKMRYVLAHEYAHYRLLDPVWTALRNILLAVYWWDLFVWAAAYASRGDCELACDEAAIKSLGEDERFNYGRALMGLIAQNGKRNIVSASTTMTGSVNRIKERVEMISKKPKTFIPVLIAVIIIAALVVGCSFTGADNKDTSLTESDSNTDIYNNVDDAELLLQAQLEGAINTQQMLQAQLENEKENKAALLAQLAEMQNKINELKAQIEAVNPPYYSVAFSGDDTFKLEFRLPDGWSVGQAEDGTVSINKGNVVVGSITYNYFKLYPDVPEDRFFHMVYSDFMNSNMVDWDSGYMSVSVNGTTHTATDRAQWYVRLDGGLNTDEYETAAVLAYDTETFVYSVINFNRDFEISDEQLTAIAESMQIKANTIMKRQVYDYITSEYKRVFSPYYNIYTYNMTDYTETVTADTVEAEFMFTMEHDALDGSGLQDLNAFHKIVRSENDADGTFTLYMNVSPKGTMWEEITVDNLIG